MSLSAGIIIKNGVRVKSATLNGGGRLAQGNLALYLDANNPASYPGTGNTWYDLSGQGNDVTMQVANAGDITYTQSNGGYFTLANDGYFNNLSTSNLPTGPNPYTLSAWVRWPSGSWPGTGGIMSIGSAFGAQNGVNAFRTNGTNGFLNYWWANDLSATSNVNAAAWLNAVATWDGYNRYIYVNGILYAGGEAAGLNTSDGTLQVGITYTGGGEGLNGNIGQALIYTRALTAREIFTNYVYTKGRYGV